MQAKPWLDYTKQIGGHIAAIEFMNEPTLLSFGGVPKGYDAASFGRDAKIFGAFLHQESPRTIYLGPGSVTFFATADDVPHGEFVTRAWVDDPLRAVLAKIPGYPRTPPPNPRKR